MISPCPLSPGDLIAIISPASPVKEEYIAGACRFLESEGYRVRVMPHAKGPGVGSYAASESERLQDFLDAWHDPEVRAILCSRGGYGAVHLLDRIDQENLRQDPKWLIGFSDISALHALLLRKGIMSLHSPMAKHLSEHSADDPCTRRLLDCLQGKDALVYTAPASEYNRPGEASGMLAGGNLAVLNGLFGTPYDILSIDHIVSAEDRKGNADNEKNNAEYKKVSADSETDGGLILFIEDIGEAIYAVERMLYHIHLAGGFRRVKGLIIGQFTEYRPDRNYDTMEAMISAFLTRVGLDHIPTAFNFPVGHVDANYPLISGAPAHLRVLPSGVRLRLL